MKYQYSLLMLPFLHRHHLCDWSHPFLMLQLFSWSHPFLMMLQLFTRMITCSYPFQVFLRGCSPPPVLIQSTEVIKKTSDCFLGLLTVVLYTRQCRPPGLSVVSCRDGCEPGPHLVVFSQRKQKRELKKGGEMTVTLNNCPPRFHHCKRIIRAPSHHLFVNNNKPYSYLVVT